MFTSSFLFLEDVYSSWMLKKIYVFSLTQGRLSETFDLIPSVPLNQGRISSPKTAFLLCNQNVRAQWKNYLGKFCVLWYKDQTEELNIEGSRYNPLFHPLLALSITCIFSIIGKTDLQASCITKVSSVLCTGFSLPFSWFYTKEPSLMLSYHFCTNKQNQKYIYKCASEECECYPICEWNCCRVPDSGSLLCDSCAVQANSCSKLLSQLGIKAASSHRVSSLCTLIPCCACNSSIAFCFQLF